MDTDSLNIVKSIGSDSVTSTKPSSFEQEQAILHFEQPKFDLEKVQLQFDLRNGLRQLLVSNNVMYIFTSTIVYRIDLSHPFDVAEIDLPGSPESSVTNAWLHPSGQFLIIQVNNTQYFHLHISYSKFKSLPRFKGLQARFVVFSELPDTSSTGDFLIATKDGNVFVAMIKSHEPATQGLKRDDKYVKNVYKTKGQIFGLSVANNNSQIQLFVDGQLLVWDCFEFVLAEITRDFRQEPTILSTAPQDANTVFLSRGQNYYIVVPETLDIYSNDEELQLSNTEKLNVGEGGILNSENSFISSAHHLIFMSSKRDSLIIVNKLTSQSPVVKNLPTFTQGTKPLGIVSDPIGNTHWLYTSNEIFELSITNESVSVWYNYYQIGDYERALRLLDASDQNSSTWFKKNVVMVKQGYDLLQKGGFGVETYNSESSDGLFDNQVKGIRILSALQEPFEKVCLMLLNMHSSPENSILSNILLVEYLKVKFKNAKEVEHNKLRMVVLSSWIVRIYVELIQAVDREARIQSDAKVYGEHMANGAHELPARDFSQELNDQLDNFLSTNCKVVDSKTIYQILTDMDFSQKLLFFADILEDYEFILNQHMDEEHWLDALKVLVKMYTKDRPKASEIIYSSSVAFLINSPRETVELWLKLPTLDYERLLPAILSYNKSGNTVNYAQNPSIHFLLKLINEKSVRNPTVVNYYLTLLISYPSQEDEQQAVTKVITKTLQHIISETQSNSRKRAPYDPGFLLRLCLRFKRYQPAVLILINDMELYDAALKLALDNNLSSLAEYVLKQYDSSIFQDESGSTSAFEESENGVRVTTIKLEDEHFAMRKKLWMTYATFLIEKVCNGEKVEVLDAANLELLPPPKETKKDIVQSITSSLVNSVNGNNKDDAEALGLSKVLHYLLLLSFSGKERAPVLSLKDLLPLFPSSITISNFKEEIVNSLNLYNNSINQLSLEMQESADIAENLKKQIQDSALKEKNGTIYTIIEPGESCSLCKNLLVDRNFIVFPNCHHCFHKDCVVRFYLKLKGDYRFKKMFQAFRQTSTVADKAELDAILLKECVLCNDKNLNTLDDPLVDQEQNKAEIEEWQL